MKKGKHMARWLVTVSAEIPYPWSRMFSIERSTAAAAASDAVKKFKLAVREKCMKSKKLDCISMKIERATDIPDCGSE